MKIYLYKLNFLLNKSLFPIFKLLLMIFFSIIIGLSIFILLEDYENIRSRIRGYILGYTKIWLWIKAIGIVLLVFMIIYNWDSIFAFLKYKTTPSWFSAIGTISAVVIALLPKLKKSPDLNPNFSIEEESKNTFKAKLEISNMLDRPEKISVNTGIYYYSKKNNEMVSFTKLNSPYEFTYRNEYSLPVFGNETSTFYSEPEKFDMSKIFSKDIPYLMICETRIKPFNSSKNYWLFSIYKIKNSKFVFLRSYFTNNYAQMVTNLNNIYKLKTFKFRRRFGSRY